MPRVAILTDQPGWHGRELQRAFRALDVQSVFASLRAIAARYLGRPAVGLRPAQAR